MVPPPAAHVARKDQWIREVQKTVEAAWKPKIIRVIYELFNPEVEQQRKFLNGPVVDYWVIARMEILDRKPTAAEHRKARETLLDKALGYDVELLDRTVRRRKSTADFVEVQEMHDFLEMLRETEFEPNGYEFPDSEAFWDLAKKHGYDKAKDVAIEQLQARITKKLASAQ